MNAIERAVEAAGGQQKLAEAIGVKYQAVQKWLRNRKLPAERVIAVEEATGVPRGDLRPDLYPVEPKPRKRAS